MKKLLAILLIMILVFSFAGCRENEITESVSSEEEIVPTEPIGKNENISWNLSDGVLTISGEGKISYETVNKIRNLENKDKIVEVVIEEGVTNIPAYMFFQCFFSIKKVTIPDSVRSIGNNAFIGCDNLKSINIPNSVVEIGYSVFVSCENLEDITISDRALPNINRSLFGSTKAFADKSKWENGVLYIGNHLIAVDKEFSGDLKVKEGTKTIGRAAFRDCTKLESIIIPASVEYIDEGIFEFDEIKSVTVSEDNKYYSSKDGMLYDKNENELIIKSDES